MRTTSIDAHKLMHEGALALAQLEHNGIRIDEKQLAKSFAETAKGIEKNREAIYSDPLFKDWKKKHGSKTNINSGSQLASFVFGEWGFVSEKKTATGRVKADAEAFEKIDLPIVRAFSELQKLEKVHGTFLRGIERETVNGFIHPIFSLHIARTFRSSSEKPNFQNQPIRDPIQASWIRSCFVARKNHQLVERDYGAIEVCASCFYHNDPTLVSYIKEDYDMHRDMAAQCYMLEPKKVSKEVRYCGKNKYVFPQFYGDFYPRCARSLWDAIDAMDLRAGKNGDGKPLKKHLAKKGITSLGECDPSKPAKPGTFEKHIQEVEKDFWRRRFKTYNSWKHEWYNSYVETGGFKTLTGFSFFGQLQRNDVINYPIQGVAFHILLLALIKLQKELKKRKMKTLIVGQIHDSIVADVHKKELSDYMELSKWVMTEWVPKQWKFINVPLTVEAEVSPVGGSWFQKEFMEG